MSANTTPVKVKKTDLSGTSTAYKVFAVVILIMLAIFFLFPLYWIVTGSFKSAIDINAKVPVWFPMNPTMGNYDKLFAKPAFLWLFNIVFISAMAMILTCITAALAGYALGKKRFYGRTILFTIIICAMALPKQVIVIPLAQEMKLLHMSDTLWAVILPTVGWPFGVFLMKQFSETIPNEILEDADERAAVFRLSDEYSNCPGGGCPGGRRRGAEDLLQRGVPHDQARHRRSGHFYLCKYLE